MEAFSDLRHDLRQGPSSRPAGASHGSSAKWGKASYLHKAESLQLSQNSLFQNWQRESLLDDTQNGGRNFIRKIAGKTYRSGAGSVRTKQGIRCWVRSRHGRAELSRGRACGSGPQVGLNRTHGPQEGPMKPCPATAPGAGMTGSRMFSGK